MGLGVVGRTLRTRLFGPKLRLRVDLHGVSVFGPGEDHTLIRWELIMGIGLDGGVVVRSATAAVPLPPGAFGLAPEALAERLDEARSPDRRPEVIADLSGRRPSRP